MAPEVDSPGYAYTRTIVGAEDVHAGKAKRASGVTARGNTLVVRLTRPVAEFDAWTTMPFFCAVPPALQPSREGVREFPGAGPYYVKEYRLNRKVEIRRNPYYGGNREHHVDGFDVELSRASPDELVSRVVAGSADWTYTLPAIALGSSHGLIRKYGAQLRAVLAHAGPDRLDVRPQLLPPALPEQPAAATGSQLRPQPGPSVPERLRHADRSLPAARHRGL